MRIMKRWVLAGSLFILGSFLAYAEEAAKEKTTRKEIPVSVYPVNPAESVIVFWDSAISDFKNWKCDFESGKSSEDWIGVSLEFKGKAVITRKLEFDCSSFDSLIPAIGGPVGTQIEISAESDAGHLAKSFVIPDDKGHTTEYALPLNGAKRITQLRITMSNPNQTGVYLKWIIFSDSKRLADFFKMYENLGKINFSPYVKEVAEVTPSFKPSMGIYCDAAALERARGAVMNDAEAKENLEKNRSSQLNAPAPESTFAPYLSTGFRRFTRDRDYERKTNARNVGGPGWTALLLKDSRLLQKAAKQAVVLAMLPHWGSGMMSSLPGCAWEHRAFDESQVVENLVFALEFCHEYLTPYGRDLILRSLAEKGVATINYNAWKFDYLYECNQLAAFSMSRLGAYLAMEKAGWSHVKPYTDLAKAELDASMGRVFKEDGGYSEGPGYYLFTLGGVLPAYNFYANGRALKFSDLLPKSLQKAPDYMELFYSTDDNQCVIPVSDTGSTFGPSGVLGLARMFPGTVFGRLVNKSAKLKGGIDLKDRWTWILGDPLRKMEDPPLRNFVKVASISSACSVRQINGKTLKVAFFGDSNATAHKHPDSGSFVIEYDGETYAMDSAQVNYSMAFSKVLQREDRHNVMVPLGNSGDYIPQNRVRTTPDFSASGDDKTFHVQANLMNCWKDKFKVRARSVDSDSPENLFITDKFGTSNGKGVAFYWLSHFPFEVDGRKIAIAGKKGNRLSFEVPSGWEISTENLKRETLPDQYRLTLTTASSKGELRLQVSIK